MQRGCQSARAEGDRGAIEIGSATYHLSLGALSLTASMTIIGNGPGSTTIAQTDGHDHVITVGSGPTVTIQGVTISGGEVSGAPGLPGMDGGSVLGGGIVDTYGALTLTNDRVTDNGVFGGNADVTDGAAAGDGGDAFGAAIAVGDGFHASTLTLIGTTVNNNVAFGGVGGQSNQQAGLGGGASAVIFGLSEATIVINNSTVSDNQASAGAGGGTTATVPATGTGGTAWDGVFVQGPSSGSAPGASRQYRLGQIAS